MLNIDDQFRVGDWFVDQSAGTLRNGNDVRSLSPRPMQLLTYLADHQGELVSREDLFRNVWTGVVISDDSVYEYIRRIRKALDDDSHRPTYIQNVPRRGYRLIADVSVETATASPPKGDRAVVVGVASGLGIVVIGWLAWWLVVPYEQSDFATVAVLPFSRPADESVQAYIGDGLAEQVIDRLGRVDRLKVIARPSSFEFRGQGDNAAAVGQALGATHVVTGEVRREGERVFVDAELVETSQNRLVWSGRFERDVTTFESIQREVTVALAEALGGNALLRERLASGSTDAEAFDAYLAARYHLADPTRGASFWQGLPLLLRAAQLDPNFAAVHAGLARYYLWCTVACKWEPDQPNWHDEMALIVDDLPPMFRPRDVWPLVASQVDRALSLDPENADAMWIRARVLMQGGTHDFRGALDVLARAYGLHPNHPEILATLYDVKTAVGVVDVELLDRAILVDPRGAARHYHSRAMWHLYQGNDDVARSDAERALELGGPNFGDAISLLAAIAAHTGDEETLAEMQARIAEVAGDNVIHPLVLAGDHDGVRAMLARDDGYMYGPADQFWIRLWLGDFEEAMRLTAKIEHTPMHMRSWVLESGTPGLPFTTSGVEMLHKARQRDEFQAMLRTIGLDDASVQDLQESLPGQLMPGYD